MPKHGDDVVGLADDARDLHGEAAYGGENTQLSVLWLHDHVHVQHVPGPPKHANMNPRPIVGNIEGEGGCGRRDWPPRKVGLRSKTPNNGATFVLTVRA